MVKEERGKFAVNSWDIFSYLLTSFTDSVTCRSLVWGNKFLLVLTKKRPGNISYDTFENVAAKLKAIQYMQCKVK